MMFRDPPDVEWCVKSQASEGIDQLNAVLVAPHCEHPWLADAAVLAT